MTIFKHRLRTAGVASATALATVMLAACGNHTQGEASTTPRYGGVLRIVGGGGQDDLDPTSDYGAATITLSRAFTRQLITWPASNNAATEATVVPDAAQEVPSAQNGGISADGLTYTFHLRPGVTWNNGRAVSVDDWVRAFKRMCNPASPVGNANYYVPLIDGMDTYCAGYRQVDPASARAMAGYQDSHDISGVIAENSSTLQIKLVHPASDFLDIIAMPFVSAVPVEYNQYIPGSNQLMSSHLMSDGPFIVSNYSPGRNISMIRNPHWSQDTDPVRHQYVSQIQVTEGQPDPELVQQQLEQGSQDLSYDQSMPVADLGMLAAKNDPDFGVYGGGLPNPYLVLNTRSGPLSGPSGLLVRQALEYAVSKNAISQLFGGPRYNQPMTTAIPSGTVGYQDYDPYPATDDQRAGLCRKYLTKAGYTNGRVLTLKAAYRIGGSHPDIFRSYKADLQACGINVTALAEPQSDLYTKLLQNNQATLSDKWDLADVGFNPDWAGNNGRSLVVPLFDGRNWTDNTANYGGYNDPVTNSLIDAALSAKDQATAAADFHKVDEQVMQDAAIVPLLEQKVPLYHSSRVHNAIFSQSTQQFDITQLWLSN